MACFTRRRGVANTLVPIPIKYRAAVSHTRLTFPIEIKTAGRSVVRIYEPRNDSKRSCGKGGLLLPSAGSALCVERNGSDKTGLRLRQRLWECWRLAYAPWLDRATHRAMSQGRYLRQSVKSRIVGKKRAPYLTAAPFNQSRPITSIINKLSRDGG